MRDAAPSGLELTASDIQPQFTYARVHLDQHTCCDLS